MNGRSTQPGRHAARHQAAVATITSTGGPLPAYEAVTADGRRSYPSVVQYDVRRGERIVREDLPPLEDDVMYTTAVHDLPAYDRLRAAGMLEVGHRLPPAGPPDVVDDRPAPGG